MSARLGLAALLLALPASAQAASAEHIGCVYERWSEADRLSVLDGLSDEAPAAAQVRGERLMLSDATRCAVDHSWSDDEMLHAMTYATMDILIGFHRQILTEKGTDPGALTRYFEANRAALVAGPDDYETAQAAARRDLAPAGFPVEDPESFEIGMSMIGMMIQAERSKADFVAGRPFG